MGVPASMAALYETHPQRNSFFIVGGLGVEVFAKAHDVDPRLPCEHAWKEPSMQTAQHKRTPFGPDLARGRLEVRVSQTPH